MKRLDGQPEEVTTLVQYEAYLLRQLRVVEYVSGRGDKMLRSFLPGPAMPMDFNHQSVQPF